MKKFLKNGSFWIIIAMIIVVGGLVWSAYTHQFYGLVVQSATQAKTVTVYGGTVYTDTETATQYIKLGPAAGNFITLTVVDNPVSGQTYVLLPVCVANLEDCQTENKASTQYVIIKDVKRVDGQPWPNFDAKSLEKIREEKQQRDDSTQLFFGGVLLVIGLLVTLRCYREYQRFINWRQKGPTPKVVEDDDKPPQKSWFEKIIEFLENFPAVRIRHDGQ